jgi:capsular exopolysaccharide synthesis family protein
MSHIFDALQRSEGPGSGVVSHDDAEATELLIRAEKRMVAQWNAAAIERVSGQSEPAAHKSVRSSAAPPTETAVEVKRTAAEAAQDAASEEFFTQCLPLQVSVSAQNRLVSYTDGESPAAEAFRLLGVRLRNLRRTRPIKRVLITSTIPQEGKSMIASNLACTLAINKQEKVLLIDGDFRRPSLLEKFGIESQQGLSEWLQEEPVQMPSIYHLEEPGMWLLPSGPAPNMALELLQSARLPVLLERLGKFFDWIVIDSPPILPLADASVWARLVDGILLVARRGTTERRQLLRGVEAIEPKKLIGALLNCSAGSAHSAYYYYKPGSPVANAEESK